MSVVSSPYSCLSREAACSDCARLKHLGPRRGERLTALTPVVLPNVDPFRNPEHCELLASGLRLAAGETT